MIAVRPRFKINREVQRHHGATPRDSLIIAKPQEALDIERRSFFELSTKPTSPFEADDP
jgi:hypothetical protein